MVQNKKIDENEKKKQMQKEHYMQEKKDQEERKGGSGQGEPAYNSRPGSQYSNLKGKNKWIIKKSS